MHRIIAYLVCFTEVLLVLSIFGNTDTRQWEFSDGRKFSAALTEFNVETGEVLLEFDDSTLDTNYNFHDFSAIDKAWLIEWSEFSQKLQALVDELEGNLVYFETTGNYPTDPI